MTNHMTHRGSRLLVLALFACLAVGAFAQEPEGGDKTLSPYFFVKSDEPGVDQLPLKSTTGDVKVAGVIADILVTQVYKNEGKRPIEAIYVFPASSKAAVYGLKMTIGERTIVAKIQKKEEARRMYEEAKQQGKSASLLEQERPNVFSMNVANIMPGDEIKVELSYTELLVPNDGVYEFVYPTVVGPRYSSPSQANKPDAPKWAANPYLSEGEQSKTTFGMKVAISAGLPIQDAVCNTHKTSIEFEGKNNVKVSLDESEKYGGNRDFILKYRLAGGQIQSGLLLYRGDTENFFLLMVQPPKNVSPEIIPPREYVFVVDVSGSMHGFPLDTAKTVMKDLFSKLRPTDYFNIMFFSGGNQVLSPESLPANEENVEKALAMMSRQRGGGGTEMLPALKAALALPRHGKISRSMVVVTDGYVSVEKEIYELVRKNLNEGNLFSFGIGSSVNRFLMETLARAGMGEPFIVTKPDSAAEQCEKFRRYVQSPVLTGIKVDFGDFQAQSVEPPSVPDVLAERPVIIFGKWSGNPAGTITLTGTSGEGEYKQTFDVAAVKPENENSALRYLWARHRIAVLSDFNTLRNDPEIVADVTKLGLDYNLLTAHTSFVAIDSLARAKPGEAQTVNQPLPLPEGVSNLAVGGSSGKAKMEMSYRGGPVMPAMSTSDSFSEKEYSRAPAPQQLTAKPSAPPPPPMKKPDADDSKKSGPGKITVGGIMVSGGLSSDAVRQAVESKREALLQAYRKALAASPALRGKLGLELTIDGTGKVLSAKVFNDEVGDKKLVEEIVKLFKEIVFPALSKKDKLEFTLVLTLDPS